MDRKVTARGRLGVGWVGHPKTMMPMCGHRRMTKRARSSPLRQPGMSISVITRQMAIEPESLVPLVAVWQMSG